MTLRNHHGNLGLHQSWAALSFIERQTNFKAIFLLYYRVPLEPKLSLCCWPEILFSICNPGPTISLFPRLLQRLSQNSQESLPLTVQLRLNFSKDIFLVPIFFLPTILYCGWFHIFVVTWLMYILYHILRNYREIFFFWSIAVLK